MWLHSEFGLMYVGKEDAIWSFDPTNLDIKPRVETRLYGGVGVKAVTRGENCFYFLDPLAVVRCDGSSFAEISNPFVRNYLEAIPKEWFYRVWMEYYDHTLYIGVPQKIDKEDIIDVGGDQVIDASTNDVIINNAVATNIILVYDVPKQRWYVLTGWDVLSATTSFSPAFGRHLYLGSTSSGYVYDAFVGDDDDGTPIESIIRTKDDCFGEPETLKDYEKFFVTGEKLTVDDVQLTLTLYRDRVAAGVVIADSTTLLDSFIHNKLEIPAPDMGGPGTYLGVEIKATKRWLFRSLTQVVRPREATY